MQASCAGMLKMAGLREGACFRLKCCGLVQELMCNEEDMHAVLRLMCLPVSHPERHRPEVL